MLPFFFFFSYTLLSLALLASQTTALPRRYPSDLFSSLFSSSHHAENSRFRAAIPQHPFIAATTINTVFTHPYPQQCPLSPPALAHDLAADQHPRSPLPTAQNPSDARHSDKTDYSRACNLGYRISSLEEDAAEIASVQCQGGTVKRIVVVAASASASSSSVSTKAEEGDDTVAKSQSQSSLSPSEEDEVKTEGFPETYKTNEKDANNDTQALERSLIHLAISKCVYGEVIAVKAYLRALKESYIFLREIDALGNTAMVMAAAERRADMVRFLTDEGYELNIANRNGRSPLMEAVLWGRIENVLLLLLKAGADKNVRDECSRRAIDLAFASDQNDRERFERAGGVYCEDTYNANKVRIQNARILKDKLVNPGKGSFQAANMDLQHRTFIKSPQDSSIKLLAPIADFPVANLYKTVARLVRGLPHPHLNAMSGWSHSGVDQITISGKTWTEEVFRISKLVDHHLAVTPDRDQGTLGKFNASHAQKQLVAAFISEHVFLQNEVGPIDQQARKAYEMLRNSRYFGPSFSKEERAAMRFEQRIQKQFPMRRLRLDVPSVSLTKAIILISSNVCHECSNFVAAINAQLGLSIQLHEAFTS